MKIRLNRLLALWIAAILFGGTLGNGYLGMAPAVNAGTDLIVPDDLATASADQLKKAAYADIRAGKFDQTSDLLSRAAGITHDATDVTAAKWAGQFQSLCQQFTADRHEQFQKAVANVKLLANHDLATYAMDELSRAYQRADDKDLFRKEPWVDALVAKSVTLAKQYEDSEQWLKSLRLYSDLSTLDPASAVWKGKVKLVTRRVRLLMVYAPQMLKKLQEAEGTERKTAEELLAPPSTQPSAGVTSPATQPTASTQSSDETTTDWHDVVKGIEYGMLWDALRDADLNYYRAVTYQGLLKGGLMGVHTIITTPGLEHTFPALADKEKSKEFLDVIASCQQAADNANDTDAETVLSQSLDKLLEENKKTVNIPEEVFISEFADGTFSTLDPFSTIIWPYDSAEFKKTTQGEFGGVGIQIENDAEGNLKIVSPLEDTPAYRAGIKAGETITQINHKSAKIPIDRAVREITGTAGTQVTLTIRSANGKERDYTITREVIKVASIKGFSRKPRGGWDYLIDPANGIAYIRLTNFSRKTAEDLQDALDQIQRQGAKGIVLDLRYNPGGLLSAAAEVVNTFIKEGVIVSTHPDRETHNQPTSISADPSRFRCDLPLVVLVNQFSASASEIVSGALKDHRRALIVGERTFGKGSVQMLYPLEGGPADAKPSLKLTTSHYYLPNGRCIHREENSSTWGVDPDVRVVMTDEQLFTMNETRRDLDVLRDAGDNQPSTKPAHKDLLSVDEQLSAALLVLRLELSGAAL